MAAPMLQTLLKRVIGVNSRNFNLFGQRLQPLYHGQRQQYCQWQEDEFAKKVHIGRTGYGEDPPHPETPAPGEYELEPNKGKPFDKKPFPMVLEPGKKYSWCACGHSKTQPFCDGTHNEIYNLRKKNEPHTYKFTPVRFTVTEEKKYWLCNCKQTNNRPYCDGTHRREDIQAKRL